MRIVAESLPTTAFLAEIRCRLCIDFCGALTRRFCMRLEFVFDVRRVVDFQFYRFLRRCDAFLSKLLLYHKSLWLLIQNPIKSWIFTFTSKIV